MAQSHELINTLKKLLKANGKTYADVAVALDLSEASVKRLFSEHGFSLQRLELVCGAIGLELSDLVEVMQNDQRQVGELSIEQETLIAEDPMLLLIAVGVLNGLSFDDFMHRYKLTEHECIQYLAKLDRLKFIDLLPGNRIKAKVSPSFRWRPNGPIQQFFLEKIEKDFFNCDFAGEGETLRVLNSMLSSASKQLVQEKIEQLAKDIEQLVKKDQRLSFEHKSGSTIVLAMRPWQYSLFDGFLR